MWSHNSITCGICGNRQCMCHMSRVSYLCTNPMNHYSYILQSSTSFLNYQSAPENTIYGFAHASNTVNPVFHIDNDQEAGEQMEINETGSWLLPNPNTNQIDESLNLPSYCSWTGNQDPAKFDDMPNQGIKVNYNGNYGQSSREEMVEQQEQKSMFTQGIQNDHPTFETGEQITTNETNTWLLPNPYTNQINGPLNLTCYCPLTGNQDHRPVDHNANYGSFSREGLEEQQEHILKLSQGIQRDYSTSASLFYSECSMPEATVRTMNMPQEWALNELSFTPFHLGNLVEETVESNLNSLDYLKRLPPSPPVSRQERILHYLEKKKLRKYKKKTIHSARKTYAQTRPRVRGRFTRCSQTDA